MNNLMYFLGALLFLAILGYAYVLLAMANKEKGAARIAGQVLSGLLVLFHIAFKMTVIYNVAMEVFHGKSSPFFR